jgi:hypothetical protein
MENAVSGPDLQVINAGKWEVGETIDAKINNVIYMELYPGPKMMDDEYLKSNIARSIDRDFTVYQKPTSYKIQQQDLHSKIYIPPTLCFCIYLGTNDIYLMCLETDWILYQRWKVFTAQYEFGL